MRYPYEDVRLAAAPEKYHYSASSGKSFYLSWKEYRNRFSSFSNIVQNSKDLIELLPLAPQSSVECNQIDLIILSVIHQHGVTESLEMFSLIKSFEINKRLYRFYSPAIRPDKGKGEASLEAYIYFGMALIAESNKNRLDLRCVSALSKLLDILCGEFVAIDNAHKHCVSWLVREEIRLVEVIRERFNA